ncbi:MAG: hypothetical protein D6711_07750 [Chloroflexi bacterium]|nr:MAG: hypothetical protein D6711_07750 [Chloroflexota bacterium]
MQEPPMMQPKGLNFTFFVKDFDKSLTFYRDVLGLRYKTEWRSQYSRGVIFDIGNDGEFQFYGPPEGKTQTEASPAGVKIAFLVDDVDAHYTRIKAAGAEIVEEINDKPWGDRSFGIKDPDGLILYIYSKIAEKETP